MKKKKSHNFPPINILTLSSVIIPVIQLQIQITIYIILVFLSSFINGVLSVSDLIMPVSWSLLQTTSFIDNFLVCYAKLCQLNNIKTINVEITGEVAFHSVLLDIFKTLYSLISRS